MDHNSSLIVAIIGGTIPAVAWLFFWLREDKEHPEPKGLLFITFLVGMATVIFVLPFEQLAKERLINENLLVIIWAFAEEAIKYLTVYFVVLKTNQINEPIDYPIFMIVSALGFAALENALFIIQPLSLGNSAVGLMTGNLRFLGATLLHSVASSIVGIAMGLAFFSSWFTKKVALVIGLLTATVLHSVFNFFIMKDSGGNFFSVFGFLWVITIITMLLFEKLRRMSQIMDD